MSLRSNQAMKVKPTCELERTCLLLVYLLAAPRTPKVRGILEARVPHCANEWPRSREGPRFDILKKTVGRETGSLSHLGLMVQTEHAQEKPRSTNTVGVGAM